jgi:hypothetical protein
LTPDEEEAKEVRRTQEINSAMRSIETNFFASFLFLTIILYQMIFPITLACFINSIVKGLVPIFTTIANFANIRQILLSYWSKLITKMNSVYKLCVGKFFILFVVN